MCDQCRCHCACNNTYPSNSTYPWNNMYPWNNPYPNNNFIHHYLQQHAILNHHFQKLLNLPHCGSNFHDMHHPGNAYGPADSSSSSCSSCCSGRSSASSCSSSSSSEYEEEETYNAEGYDDEDESECEYEFNVDAILAMRAAKEKLKKEESPDSTEESEDKSENESKSDSIVLVDSDKEDFEFVDLSSMKMLDFKLDKGVGKFNRSAEREAKKKIMQDLYGDKKALIGALETAMNLNMERYCDKFQPSLWPVLPLRL